MLARATPPQAIGDLSKAAADERQETFQLRGFGLADSGGQGRPDCRQLIAVHDAALFLLKWWPNGMNEQKLATQLTHAHAKEPLRTRKADDLRWIQWLANKLKAIHRQVQWIRKYPARMIYRMRSLSDEEARSSCAAQTFVCHAGPV